MIDLVVQVVAQLLQPIQLHDGHRDIGVPGECRALGVEPREDFVERVHVRRDGLAHAGVPANGKRREHDLVVAARELQVIPELHERLLIFGARETVDERIDLLGDLIGRHVLGFEIRGGSEIPAQLLRTVADEDAAIEDEGQTRPAWVAAEGATQLEAVHPRHLHVRHDRVHRLRLEQFEGGGAVGGGEDFVSGLAEQSRQQTSAGHRIVNDEHAHWSHRPPLVVIPRRQHVLCQTARSANRRLRGAVGRRAVILATDRRPERPLWHGRL